MDEKQIIAARTIQLQISGEIKHVETLLSRVIAPILFLVTVPSIVSLFLVRNVHLYLLVSDLVIVIGFLFSVIVAYFSFIMFKKFPFRIDAARELNSSIQEDITSETLNDKSFRSHSDGLNKLMFPPSKSDVWEEIAEKIKNEKNIFRKIYKLYSSLHDDAIDAEQFLLTNIFAILVFFVVNGLLYTLLAVISLPILVFIIQHRPPFPINY